VFESSLARHSFMFEGPQSRHGSLCLWHIPKHNLISCHTAPGDVFSSYLFRIYFLSASYLLPICFLILLPRSWARSCRPCLSNWNTTRLDTNWSCFISQKQRTRQGTNRV